MGSNSAFIYMKMIRECIISTINTSKTFALVVLGQKLRFFSNNKEMWGRNEAA